MRVGIEALKVNRSALLLKHLRTDDMYMLRDLGRAVVSVVDHLISRDGSDVCQLPQLMPWDST